jgi:hypothetical protein
MVPPNGLDTDKVVILGSKLQNSPAVANDVINQAKDLTKGKGENNETI